MRAGDGLALLAGEAALEFASDGAPVNTRAAWALRRSSVSCSFCFASRPTSLACSRKALIAYLAVMMAPARSPAVAMPVIHVGMSPQVGPLYWQSRVFNCREFCPLACAWFVP